MNMNKFKVGNVVSVNRLPHPLYAIRKCITDGSTKHMYEVMPIDSILWSDNVYLVNESDMNYEYRDAQWMKYFTESVRNGLPPWRGEIYNFMRLSEGDWDLYENDILPPKRMRHILEEHSFYRRIKRVMEVPQLKDEILKRMNRTETEVKEIIHRIRMKIAYRNGMCPKEKLPKYKNGHDSASFDFEEDKLIAVVDYCDKYVNKESKDHFPPYMSDYEIMKAIQDAYKTAEKVEIMGRGNQGLQEAKTIYQGKSDKGLDIQFYYNLDLDIIESAYPVFVDTTNRPDLQHPNKK